MNYKEKKEAGKVGWRRIRAEPILFNVHSVIRALSDSYQHVVLSGGRFEINDVVMGDELVGKKISCEPDPWMVEEYELEPDGADAKIIERFLGL